MTNITNEHGEQKYDNELDSLYSKFFRYVPFSELLPFFESGYELIRQHGCKNSLINLTQLAVHDIQTTEYFNNVWFASVKQLGVENVAIVMPATAVGKMSSQNANKNAANINGLMVNNFSEEAEAREWLNTVKR